MQIVDWRPIGQIRDGGGPPRNLLPSAAPPEFSFEARDFLCETVCCRYAPIETRVLAKAYLPGTGPKGLVSPKGV